MQFHERRRQQFLSETTFREAEEFFQVAVLGPEGLLANLLKPEDEPGWHLSLLRNNGRERHELMLLRYTAGEPIESLRPQLEQVISAYLRYAERLWSESGDRNEMVFQLHSVDDYCQLMQLVGLCFLLHRRDLLPNIAQLEDGVDAIGQIGQGNGGADWVFEEFMSFGVGPEKRYESEQIACARPYELLADALSTEDNVRAIKALDRFLSRWYKDLAGTGWHDTHKPNETGHQGGYHGYWSFEAGAAVILLGIEDDTSLHKYAYYPKDLVNWSRANAVLAGGGAQDAMRLRCLAGQPCPKQGEWFTPARNDSRRRFESGELMPEVDGTFGATIWQFFGD